MKALTTKERAQLSTKIGQHQYHRQQEQRKLARTKRRDFRPSIGMKNWLPNLGHSSYGRRLRESLQSKARHHIFDAKQPLRIIKLSQSQKKQLLARLNTAQ